MFGLINSVQESCAAFLSDSITLNALDKCVDLLKEECINRTKTKSRDVNLCILQSFLSDLCPSLELSPIQLQKFHETFVNVTIEVFSTSFITKVYQFVFNKPETECDLLPVAVKTFYDKINADPNLAAISSQVENAVAPLFRDKICALTDCAVYSPAIIQKFKDICPSQAESKALVEKSIKVNFDMLAKIFFTLIVGSITIVSVSLFFRRIRRLRRV